MRPILNQCLSGYATEKNRCNSEKTPRNNFRLFLLQKMRAGLVRKIGGGRSEELVVRYGNPHRRPRTAILAKFLFLVVPIGGGVGGSGKNFLYHW